MKFSIVVPAHNEQDNIIDVVNKIEHSLDLDFELIIVNDHSTDCTPELALKLSKRYPNIRLIENLNEGGFANAIKSGFASIKTELVVPIMADLCDDLNTIKEMYKKINEGYDIVCGARYARGGARIGGLKIKGFLSCFAGNSLYYLLGLPTCDIANAFKMYRKRVIDSVDIKAKSFEVSMEITLKAYYSGFKITEVPTVWRERTKGKSSFRMLKLLPGYLRVYAWAIAKRFKI